jgi:multidrug resistance protein
MFAIGTDSFVVAGVLGQVSASLGVSVALAGQMVTLYALSYAVLSPVIAAAAAHWPRKRLLLTGLAVFVLGNVVTALSPSIELVLASRLLAGLGAAMFSPTATAAGASLVPPEQRGRALAIVIAGLSSATALGAPLGTFIGGWLDWRATMWFVAAVGTLAAAGVAWRLPDIPNPPAVRLARRLAPLRDARVLLTLLTTWLVYAGLFLVYTYIGSSFGRHRRRRACWPGYCCCGAWRRRSATWPPRPLTASQSPHHQCSHRRRRLDCAAALDLGLPCHRRAALVVGPLRWGLLVRGSTV